MCRKTHLKEAWDEISRSHDQTGVKAAGVDRVREVTIWSDVGSEAAGPLALLCLHRGSSLVSVLSA